MNTITINLTLGNTPNGALRALLKVNAESAGAPHLDWTMHSGNVIRTDWQGRHYVVKDKPTWYEFTPHTTTGWLFVLDFLLAHAPGRLSPPNQR